LKFGSGILPEELIIISSENNLLVGLREAGVDFKLLVDKIDITNWNIVNNSIETFKFDNSDMGCRYYYDT
jgi:hypothetical protein